MLDHIRLGVFLVSLVLLLVSIPVMAVGAATAWLTTDIIANILIVDLLLAMVLVGLGGEF
jgi:hypothetical protein